MAKIKYVNQVKVVTPGTRVQLANVASSTVKLQALKANTGNIFVGDGTVAATTGYELAAGDTVEFDVDNLNELYIDSAVANEGVAVVVF